MKKWLKILGGLFVLGVIAALLVYFFVYNKPHPDWLELKPVYTLSAAELYGQFESASEVANEKYSGKILLIEGIYDHIERVDSLVIAVFVFNQGVFGDEGVRCTMLQAQNKLAANIFEGNSIKIKGFCSGYNDTDVILEKCSLIQKLEVSSEKLE